MITPEDERRIEDLIAEKLDIMSAFRDLPPAAFEEIARDLHSRPASVRETLREDERFVAVRAPNRSQRAVGWMLRAEYVEGRDESGRVLAQDVVGLA